MGCLEGARRREVGGTGVPRHIRAARAVHGDALAPVVAGASEVGGIDEAGAAGIELRYEGVDATPGGRLVGPRRRWEVLGESGTRHIGAARTVYGDPVALIGVAASEIGGIDRGAARVELGHKDVVGAR